MTYLQNLCTYVFHAGKKLLKALGKRKRLGLFRICFSWKIVKHDGAKVELK